MFASPFFIILQNSISLVVNLTPSLLSFVPNEDVNSCRFFCSSFTSSSDSPVNLSFCTTGNNRCSALAITLSFICFFSISICPRISLRAIFFCSKISFCSSSIFSAFLIFVIFFNMAKNSTGLPLTSQMAETLNSSGILVPSFLIYSFSYSCGIPDSRSIFIFSASIS